MSGISRIHSRVQAEKDQANNERFNISLDVVKYLSAFVDLMTRKFAKEVIELLKNNGTTTVTCREIHTVIRLCLPGNLQKHAITNSDIALKKVAVYLATRERPDSGIEDEEEANPEAKNEEKPKKQPKTAKRIQAGIDLSVSKVDSEFRSARKWAAVRKLSMVYLAATLDYLCMELLMQADKKTKAKGKKTIMLESMQAAIHDDEDFKDMFRDIITIGGPLNPLDETLLPKKTKPTGKRSRSAAVHN